jgi:uncharacterized protein (TIGR02246 family)
MEANTTDRGDFIPYPTNRVVGTVVDANRARAAIDALLRAGFDRQDIDILHGEEGEQRLDPEGAEHGFLAQFQRTLIRAAGPAEEYKSLMRHFEDVRAGRFVIMVLAKKREQRTVAADILNAHGAEFVGFYGRWAWEGLSGDVQPVAPDGSQREHAVAMRADEIPALFVHAWNSRDPDALASLFDEDAEFVTVTGMWWHDRGSIRSAHADGLERIFSASTLTIDETRIKQLSDDVAVVYARMTLSGQTPIADVERPGSRTSILSFVVRRADGRWQCASAHNTDVVPRMETNVVDDDGIHRSANYRTGRLSESRHS